MNLCCFHGDLKEEGLQRRYTTTSCTFLCTIRYDIPTSRSSLSSSVLNLHIALVLFLAICSKLVTNNVLYTFPIWNHIIQFFFYRAFWSLQFSASLMERYGDWFYSFYYFMWAIFFPLKMRQNYEFLETTLSDSVSFRKENHRLSFHRCNSSSQKLQPSWSSRLAQIHPHLKISNFYSSGLSTCLLN